MDEIKDQPPPKANESRPIWELVVADMHERDRIGRERYGTPLQAHNGRDALVDAYQEALDQVVYLRQAIAEERRGWAVIPAPSRFSEGFWIAMGFFSLVFGLFFGLMAMATLGPWLSR